MFFVWIIAAALCGFVHLLYASYLSRFSMLALLFLGVLPIQLVLPLGHPLREMTGGSPALWLMLAGAGWLLTAGGCGWCKRASSTSLSGPTALGPRDTGQGQRDPGTQGPIGPGTQGPRDPGT